jgi:inhibitor of cysteine peptidase
MSKRRKIIIVLVAFLGIILVGLGIHFKPSSPNLTEIGDYNVTIKKKTFEIDLASNSSTGYSWVTSDVDTDAVTLDSITYHTYPSKSDVVGSGGYSQLTGKVRKAGKQTFNLTYCQDWDGGEKEMTYQVTISSTKNKINKIKLTKVSE